jgi:hypothetical protein
MPLSAAQRPQCCDLLQTAAFAGCRPANHRPSRRALSNQAGCINWPRATGTAQEKTADTVAIRGKMG